MIGMDCSGVLAAAPFSGFERRPIRDLGWSVSAMPSQFASSGLPNVGLRLPPLSRKACRYHVVERRMETVRFHPRARRAAVAVQTAVVVLMNDAVGRRDATIGALMLKCDWDDWTNSAVACTRDVWHPALAKLRENAAHQRCP